MNLLLKFQYILARILAKETRYRLALLVLEKEKDKLNSDKLTFWAQQTALKKLIKNHCFKGVINKEGLFQEQRRLAVLRRQLLLITHQYNQTEELLKNNNIKKLETLNLIKICAHSADKYRIIISKEMVIKHKKHDQINEEEIEEIILWRK